MYLIYVALYYRPRRFNSQVSIIGLGSETADADTAKSK